MVVGDDENADFHVDLFLQDAVLDPARLVDGWSVARDGMPDLLSYLIEVS